MYIKFSHIANPVLEGVKIKPMTNFLLLRDHNNNNYYDNKINSPNSLVASNYYRTTRIVPD